MGTITNARSKRSAASAATSAALALLVVVLLASTVGAADAAPLRQQVQQAQVEKENPIHRHLKKAEVDSAKFAEAESKAEKHANRKDKEHKDGHTNNKNKNDIVDEAADAALSKKDKKRNDKDNKKDKEEDEWGTKHDHKKQSPVEHMTHDGHVMEHEWQPLADKLFTCRMASAVCSPDILKRLRFALLAAAKMHDGIWFMGGWALSMLGFAIFVIGVLISKMVDGDNDASGGGGKDGALSPDYQPVSAQSTDDSDDVDDDNVGGGGDIESPTKADNVSRNHALIPSSGMGRYTAQSALFWNRHIARKEGGVGGSHKRRPKRSKSSSPSGNGTSTHSAEHFDNHEMTFLPPPPDSSASPVPPKGDGVANGHGLKQRSFDLDKDDEDEDDTSPSKLKRTPYHLEVGPNATSLRAIVDRIPDNVMKYWTDTTLYFTRPLLSFKFFLACLLFIELNEIMAPEQSMLATPEVVKLIRAYPKKHIYVNPYVQHLMPGLTDDVDGWVRTLEIVRSILLVSWFAFLMIPKKYNLAGGAFYAVGAVLYVYLGVIGLMYDLAHSTQGGMLFILSAVPVVPFLETSHRANHWLRKFLYIGVFVPIYLFSGISKFRYLGIIPNLTGTWLYGDFGKGKLHRAVWKSMFAYIGDHHWMSFFFTWGNIFLEIILPMALMLFNEIAAVRWVFHFSAIFFHVTIFLLLGPNFTRYCLMHLYALDLLGYIPRFANKNPRPTVPRPTRADWMRVGYAVIIMLAWWYVQFNSDIMHLTGQQDKKTRINSYWPIPELSMFAKPKDTANIYIAFIFTTLSFITLVVDMIR